MKKIILALPYLILLSACAPSVDELLEDPQLMAKVSMECLTLANQGKSTNIKKCNNAEEAINEQAGDFMNKLGL